MELKYKSWSEVTIQKYYELEEAKGTKELLACLCEKSVSEIEDLPYPEYAKLVSQMTWIKTFDFDKKKDLTRIKIGNRKYKVFQDVGRMTVSQYTDFQSLYSKGDLKTYYGNVLATFLIPKGKKGYNQGYDVIEEAKYIYENLDIQRANQLMFFFLRGWLASMAVIVSYWKWVLKKQKKEMTPEILEKIEKILALPGLP